MKKLLVVMFVIFASFVGNIHAQMAQGMVMVDPYYGFPNFGARLASSFEVNGNSDFKATGLGPMGLRAEYAISDKIGIGMDVIYNNFNLTYTSVDSTYDGNTGTYTETRSANEFIMNRLRVQARINFHFESSNPDFDPYFGLGAGTNNRFRKAYQNGVEVEDDADLGNITLLPFSMRVCTGFRYYFSEVVGLNMELGLGGPVISGGLSFRF